MLSNVRIRDTSNANVCYHVDDNLMTLHLKHDAAQNEWRDINEVLQKEMPYVELIYEGGDVYLDPSNTRLLILKVTKCVNRIGYIDPTLLASISRLEWENKGFTDELTRLLRLNKDRLMFLAVHHATIELLREIVTLERLETLHIRTRERVHEILPTCASVRIRDVNLKAYDTRSLANLIYTFAAYAETLNISGPIDNHVLNAVAACPNLKNFTISGKTDQSALLYLYDMGCTNLKNVLHPKYILYHHLREHLSPEITKHIVGEYTLDT